MQPESEHQSIRLFENNFLESLTHVHPIIPLVLWSPIASYLLWRSIAVHDLPLIGLLATAILAIGV